MNVVKAVVMFVVLLTVRVHAQDDQAQEEDLIYVTAVAWNHDGTQIATVGVRPENTQGYVRVIDVQTMQAIYQEDPMPGGFTSVAWSPDDHFIAAGSYDGTVWVFNLEEAAHTATLQGHEATVDDVDWNSDGTRLVSAGDWDQSVILWDMTTYQPIRRLETPNFIYSVAFSPDSQRVAVGGETGLFVFPSTLEVGDGRDQLTYQYIRGYSSVLAWSHSGQQIAFGTQTFPLSNGERPNAHIFVVDANDPALTRDFESSWGSIAGLAWSPDDRLLAAYHQDDLVSILDTKTESVVETFTGSGPSRYSIGSLDFSPYGGRLAYGITTDPLQEARASSLENAGISIVVPAPSRERLQAIAVACNAPASIERLLPTSDAASQLSAFVSGVEALPEATIPPGCAADLLAVAAALQE